MRFLVDMPLPPRLAQWLSQQGHDAVHAADIGLARASDVDIIGRGRDEDRIIVTADLDYPRLLALSNADRPAIILFRGGEWSDSHASDRLRAAFATIPENELATSLVVIEQTRIRRRLLPLR